MGTIVGRLNTFHSLLVLWLNRSLPTLKEDSKHGIHCPQDSRQKKSHVSPFSTLCTFQIFFNLIWKENICSFCKVIMWDHQDNSRAERHKSKHFCLEYIYLMAWKLFTYGHKLFSGCHCLHHNYNVHCALESVCLLCKNCIHCLLEQCMLCILYSKDFDNDHFSNIMY